MWVKNRSKVFLDKQKKLTNILDYLKSNLISPNEASKYEIKIAQDGVKRSGIELMAQRNLNMAKLDRYGLCYHRLVLT